MTKSRSKRPWLRLVRYTLGGGACLLAVGSWLAGMPWFESFIILCAGVVLILGRRRIFRPGVTRIPNEIICRYVPWYEGNAYFLNLLLPLMGIAAIAAGYRPGNPGWLRYTGIVLIVLTPLFTSSAIRMRRRSSLRIVASKLVVRVAASKDEATEVRRESVESIGPSIVPNGVGGQWLQVEISYRAADLAGAPQKTMLLGLQLTVEPVDLLRALVAWKEGAQATPDELLDRVERLLRGDDAADGVADSP